MVAVRRSLLVLDILLTAAIAGFFYAFTASVMRGLDAAAPEVAIPAMQAINAEIRNPVFAPGFFGPAAVGVFLVLSWGTSGALAAWLARAGVAAYLLGGFLLTIAINVPMNETFAHVTVPPVAEAARQVWDGFSDPWTAWNTARTAFSFLSLALLVGAGAADLRR